MISSRELHARIAPGPHRGDGTVGASLAGAQDGPKARGYRARPGTVGEALLAALAVLAVRLAYIAYGRLTYEDAFISLRYAANLAAGHGLVYNPGERVFGATTPLYVFLLSLFAVLKVGPPLLYGKLLCALADAATTGLWHAALRRRFGSRLAGWTLALLFGLSPFIVEVAASGMETSLLLFGVTVSFLAAEAGRRLVLGVALGLTALVRLDALLFAAVLLVYRALRTRSVPWREAALIVAIQLPWLLFAGWYYGAVIPNSIPAKMAAYQAHQPSFLPNLRASASFFTPFRNGWREETFNALVAPLFLLGCIRILRRHPAWWPVPALCLAHWAFLAFSRTVLFRWYYPPALLPYYVVAGIGAGVLASPCSSATRGPLGGSLRSFAAPLLILVLVAHTSYWLWGNAQRARELQELENHTRRDIGRWLARNTAVDALVCTEPIGYIGYYSGRRILDEVGLVSPPMIAINRQGDGWFTRALRSFRPDYVVERYYFLTRNTTINASQVRMFADEGERRWFERCYRPVRWYCHNVSPFSSLSYGFIIFERQIPPIRHRGALTAHAAARS